MGFSYKLADRDTWTVGVPKTIGGDKLILVAKQQSSRLRKVTYVYQRASVPEIYYNQAKDGVVFFPIASNASDMGKFYDLFMSPSPTDEQTAFLKRNDYHLVK